MFADTPDKTTSYIRSVLNTHDSDVMLKMREYAVQKFIPILLPETAAFLSQLITLKKPSNILEIGAAIGYSGHVMLNSCEHSKLYTVEIDEELAQIAKANFNKSGFQNRAVIFCTDANELIPVLDGNFDFIFLDGPKTRYIEYYPYLKNLLLPGGVLLCDNVLFGGMVSGERESGKKASIAQKLDLFLRTVAADKDFITSILPIGDGLCLCIKKEDDNA